MVKYNKKSASYFALFFPRLFFSSAINICTINIFLPEHGSCLTTKPKSEAHWVTVCSRTTLQHFKGGNEEKSDSAALLSPYVLSFAFQHMKLLLTLNFLG